MIKRWMSIKFLSGSSCSSPIATNRSGFKVLTKINQKIVDPAPTKISGSGLAQVFFYIKKEI